MRQTLGRCAGDTVWPPICAWRSCCSSHRAFGGRSLAALPARTYDLVIIDPSPPDRAAGALVKALRTERPDISVLVLTAMDTPGLRAEMRTLGVRHYFAKPLTIRELERGVRAALGLDEVA